MHLEASRDVLIRLGATVAAVERGPAGTIVRLKDGHAITADAVILATPARASASSLGGLAPAAARALAAIPHGSTGVVSLAYRADQLAERPAGHGFLVAGDERLAFGACTWSSSKWAGRAPDGFVLARAFLGERGAGLLGLDDGALARIVHDDLARVAGIRGQPVLRRVARWPSAMPRYSLGHLDRVAALDAAMREHPDVLVTGAALRGVGVPDCIEQGRSAAQRAITLIGGREPAVAPNPRVLTPCGSALR
jgi:oxygen-dependent protoporphyrinogen oxidase